jgi:cellulose synthase/poly-beta-1,6-N-acetylglucosamine synthase-like glycosyltransferase
LARASGIVVVALDADTHFQRDSIFKLVRWFHDPSVAAVAGNAKVGNRINTITRWQALEYVTSQNLERRALATLGCITVVPGAIGAWRREAIEQLGGFPVDTLAEDQDLTIGLLRAGWRVLYDSTAIGWTEAPDSLRGLLKQRFRWTYGTLQCLWKHRHVTLKPRYKSLGLVAFPQTWLFLVLFSIVAPLVDLTLV